MKSLEQHLAEYLLSLSRGPWLKQHVRECMAMWRQRYGEAFALRVEKIVRERWHKP